MSSELPGGTATVYIVDDDFAVRATLTRTLNDAGYRVSSYASAGEFLLTRPVEREGCLLLDAGLQDANGLELHEALLRRQVNLPVVFICGCPDIRACVRAMKAGAVDFLTKPVDREALLSAVQAALVRRNDVEKRKTRLKDLRTRLQDLTPREREVMLLVVQGLPNKEIAAQLGTSLRTAKAHRASMMARMKVNSVAGLVELAHELREAGDLPPLAGDGGTRLRQAGSGNPVRRLRRQAAPRPRPAALA